MAAETFLAEIHEQPGALRRLVARRDELEQVAAALAERGVTTIRLS